ncbi:hypothetical protein SKAU_G00326950 [Synaphobranchus kaupii]|uniref:Uncharacterized protein n=1 Tax=Synaphobranchus kaupii TaxID=118154 RepID=A0A9Q1IK43_SYNKA|nr:hypothetical protein SKAU_G00326950 [Synaphobranchus kaupii]
MAKDQEAVESVMKAARGRRRLNPQTVRALILGLLPGRPQTPLRGRVLHHSAGQLDAREGKSPFKSIAADPEGDLVLHFTAGSGLSFDQEL